MAGLEQYARPSPQIPVNDIGKLTKLGVQTLFPETYQAATNWIPSMGDIFSGLGLEGFGSTGLGSALGGASMAMGYAAPMLAFAKIMSAINQNTDHPITLGGGYTSLEDGFYGGVGPEAGRAKSLADLYLGDRSWYEGGDSSKVSDLDTAIGSMSWKKSIPAFTVGGAAYRTPELAANSGRQIARGQMGLPVTLEDLPDTFRSNPAGLTMLADYMRNQSLPVWDAPEQMPSDWDVWQDRAQNSGYSNQSNTEAGSAFAPETIQAYVSGLTPRAQDWFRTGLTYNDLYAYTGEQSPDWELNDYSGEGAVSKTGPKTMPAPVVPFDPLRYGAGPGRDFFADR